MPPARAYCIGTGLFWALTVLLNLSYPFLLPSFSYSFILSLLHPENERLLLCNSFRPNITPQCLSAQSRSTSLA